MSKCKFCDGKYGESASRELIYDSVNLGEYGTTKAIAYLYDDKWIDFSIGDIERRIKIKYCPMCGRKLNPKELEEAADE